MLKHTLHLAIMSLGKKKTKQQLGSLSLRVQPAMIIKKSNLAHYSFHASVAQSEYEKRIISSSQKPRAVQPSPHIRATHA